MSDIHEFDRENAAERAARRQRAQLVNSGARSPMDGLTDLERVLLLKLRRHGYELNLAPEREQT